MARPSEVHEELSALRAELRKAEGPEMRRHPGTADTIRGAAAAETASSDALQEQLDEIGRALSEYSDAAEDILAKHPLVAVGAAFVLGIAIGRLLGRA